MNGENWKKVKDIFNEVVELEPSAKSAYLDSVCTGDSEIRREVEKLLAGDAAGETIPDVFHSFSFLEPRAVAGQLIGKYKVLSEIGHGGMGIVYLATRRDLDKKVAIKIVKRGMDSAELLSRFDHERQILATLDHPFIARLIDADTTADHLPYYVMDYVEGSDLIEYCQSRNLPIEARLEIFRKICSAVQYAHNRLVVHRDLKPSNILITNDGEPKLLDFGIAKILSGDTFGRKGTATRLGMMTPNYASPEQFRGLPVTTATDIYSLGVILYELLTGCLPYDLKNRRLDEMLEIICNTNPRRPSYAGEETDGSTFVSRPTVRHPELRGDLDNIILKALKKEPERRYVSVEQFSADIRRFLEGLPVSARPDTLRYRTAKFIKRNKIAVAAAFLFVVSLIGGIVGTAYQASVARHERNLAEQRFEDIRKLTNRLIFKYNDSIANLPGAIATREVFVSEAAEYLNVLAASDSKDKTLQLELANAFIKVGDLQGEVYGANLGDTRGAAESYYRSVTIAEKLFRAAPQDEQVKSAYGTALSRYGRILTRQGEWNAAIQNLNEAIRIHTELAQADALNSAYSQELADAYIALGDALSRQPASNAPENAPKVFAAFDAARQIGEQLVTQPTFSTRDLRVFAVANQRLGNICYPAHLPLGKTIADALRYYDQSIEYFSQIYESKPNNVKARRDYADALLMRTYPLAASGQETRATDDSVKAIKIIEEISAADPKNQELQFDRAMAYYQSALIKTKLKNWREAEKEMTEAAKDLTELLEDNPTNYEFADNLKNAYSRLSSIAESSNNVVQSEFYKAKAAEIKNRFPDKNQ